MRKTFGFFTIRFILVSWLRVLVSCLRLLAWWCKFEFEKGSKDLNYMGRKVPAQNLKSMDAEGARDGI